jgi:predicted hydrolase (HD superfamily)
VASVKRKLKELKERKERSFVSGVNRDEVYAAEEVLGPPLDEFIAVALAGLQQVAPDIGL